LRRTVRLLTNCRKSLRDGCHLCHLCHLCRLCRLFDLFFGLGIIKHHRSTTRVCGRVDKLVRARWRTADSRRVRGAHGLITPPNTCTVLLSHGRSEPLPPPSLAAHCSVFASTTTATITRPPTTHEHTDTIPAPAQWTRHFHHHRFHHRGRGGGGRGGRHEREHGEMPGRRRRARRRAAFDIPV